MTALICQVCFEVCYKKLALKAIKMTKFVNNLQLINQGRCATFPLFSVEYFIDQEKKEISCTALKNPWNVPAFDCI